MRPGSCFRNSPIELLTRGFVSTPRPAQTGPSWPIHIQDDIDDVGDELGRVVVAAEVHSVAAIGAGPGALSPVAAVSAGMIRGVAAIGAGPGALSQSGCARDPNPEGQIAAPEMSIGIPASNAAAPVRRSSCRGRATELRARGIRRPRRGRMWRRSRPGVSPAGLASERRAAGGRRRAATFPSHPDLTAAGCRRSG